MLRSAACKAGWAVHAALECSPKEKANQLKLVSWQATNDSVDLGACWWHVKGFAVCVQCMLHCLCNVMLGRVTHLCCVPYPLHTLLHVVLPCVPAAAVAAAAWLAGSACCQGCR